MPRMAVTLEEGINEGCDGGTLAQHQKTAQEDDHDENGQQPEFLANLHEGPKLGDETHDVSPQNWLRIDPTGSSRLTQ